MLGTDAWAAVQRGGHGPARYRWQGVWRPGVPVDWAEEARPHSHLRGHHGPSGCEGVRGTNAEAQGNGSHLLQDGFGDGLGGEASQRCENRGVATDKGLEYLCEFIAAIHDVLAWLAPLAADHFGPLNVQDCIRYARAFEHYQLAWAEDILQIGEGYHYPWQNWRAYKMITESTTTPINTGEDIFGLEEGFQPLLDNRALNAIHPDIETSGGLLETKRIADCAELAGVQVAMHHAGSPIGGFAGYHCAATFGDNFLAMENHALDMPWWQDLVTGVPKPMIDQGYVTVPERPGLGLELNDEVVKEHLRRPGYFEPTPMFDDYIVSGFRTGGPWPHYDETGEWCNCVTYE